MRLLMNFVAVNLNKLKSSGTLKFDLSLSLLIESYQEFHGHFDDYQSYLSNSDGTKNLVNE